MSISVTRVDTDKQFPFLIEFSHVKQRFTEKAAVELKKKLGVAIGDPEKKCNCSSCPSLLTPAKQAEAVELLDEIGKGLCGLHLYGEQQSDTFRKLVDRIDAFIEEVGQ